jgi:hypothetical protein
VGFPPAWNVDPKTRITAPLRFGKDLDYRDSAEVGDIKYLWEINRHLELVTLAQAWHLTREERYVQGCRSLLESWLTQCPYALGVNWCVSLEHAVRLVNWAFAWFLLGGERSSVFDGATGESFRQRWLASIYQHCHFIARHWSRHSSANNHLMGEATGLLVGALTWPLWRESNQWAERGRRELTEAALEQTFEDGVNKEQSPWYHHAVADMMLIGGLVARGNGVDLGEPYWRRLEAMLDFIASIMDVGGNVPEIGDADEGVLVRLVPGRGDVFQSLLATGGVLFGRPELCRKARVFDDKTRWLLGDPAQSTFDRLSASQPADGAATVPRATQGAQAAEGTQVAEGTRVAEATQAVLPVRRQFPQGGYYILGEQFETAAEVRIVADAGPLGYLSIAAHGHADALAFTLSVSGRPMLVDPGTFAYHTQRLWRRYFKGTSAHNTVVVDDEDQSVFGGNFLWLQHANAQVESFTCTADTALLRAVHDGYCRLSDPVRHRRTWQYERSRLSVLDELLCQGSHSLAIHWHFAPECNVVQHGGAIHATRDHVTLELLCPDGLTPELVRGFDPTLVETGRATGVAAADRVGGEANGALTRPLGWYSSGFDVKVPATTAVFSGRIHGRCAFRSEILIGARTGHP